MTTKSRRTQRHRIHNRQSKTYQPYPPLLHNADMARRRARRTENQQLRHSMRTATRTAVARIEAFRKLVGALADSLEQIHGLVSALVRYGRERGIHEDDITLLIDRERRLAGTEGRGFDASLVMAAMDRQEIFNLAANDDEREDDAFLRSLAINGLGLTE